MQAIEHARRHRIAIQQTLLEWYDRHHRDLPWRRTRAPYPIWISEIMLQQTQVQTVLPYYERWLRRFPTIDALAEAPLADVLKCWEGLGYYARARHLHQAAQLVRERHNGQLPDDAEALSALPGFGRYTTAAVLSIAFDRPLAVVDGNVRRVLARVFRIETPINRAPAQRAIDEVARFLLDENRPGDFNQAVMELGAIVCTPKSPQCAMCPLNALCLARSLPDPAELPKKEPRPRIQRKLVAAGLIWRDGALLIAQRRSTDMLGGLWEFPGGKVEPGETLEQCLVREIEEELGIRVGVEERFTEVKHTYSHFKMDMVVFHCRYLDGTPQSLECADWRWVHPDELDRYAFSKADLKVIVQLRRKHG